ncbi:hypothetical protein AVEN_64118-1 [Araneus ventricosus]|uniref:Uncharacterized protein n=1 Tax=Araneus ventricosus TaxID=182803 RepID=A0A4Y2C4W8_ARAVE|nr:hypothetical protein AVEN_64118-1 [Araneus ventricosus]
MNDEVIRTYDPYIARKAMGEAPPPTQRNTAWQKQNLIRFGVPEHPTRECRIIEKIENPVCINCGEKGHLAAWRGCKALPVIPQNLAKNSWKKFCTSRKPEHKKRTPFSKKGNRNCSRPPPRNIRCQRNPSGTQGDKRIHARIPVPIGSSEEM